MTLDPFYSRRIRIVDTTCWIWTGSHAVSGYGQTKSPTDPTKKAYAHRVIYELLIGPIPKGLHLDHLCRNRECVNPAHLEPVDRKTNILRGVGPPARNARKTHCLRGHPLSGDNLHILPHTGFRRCNQCAAIRARRYRTKAATC